MEKKRGILYWLRVLVCILAICLMFLRFSRGLKACAAGESYVDLTPSQTLALFGTEIQGLLVTEFNTPAQSITFDYAFPLSSIGYMDDGGGYSYSQIYGDLSISSILGRQEVSGYMSATNGLVYIASASQWGGTSIQGYNKYGSNPVQLHCPFSISLSGIGGIQQGIQYSTYPHSVSSSNLPYATDNQAIYISSPSITLDSLPGPSFANVIRAARFSLPAYSYYEYSYENGMQVFNPLDESQQLWMSGFYVNTEYQPDPFDIRGITIDCYGITSAQTNSNDLWIVVQCPRLWSYSPPVVTTTEAPTTYPAQTFPTGTYPTGTSYDPHKIIIDNQNTQIMQLNLIIGQLDRIYNCMVNSGQIAVNLMPAESLAELRTDIHSRIHDNLTSFTTSRMPDEVSNGFSFFNDLYSRFTSGPLAFFGWIGIFSLMSLVISWFIFRGRG